MNSNNKTQDAKGLCPACHNKMEQLAPRDYYCKNCNQKYYEVYICPICAGDLEQIKGCGSINYLCRKDGLVSSGKVKFHYQTLKGE